MSFTDLKRQGRTSFVLLFLWFSIFSVTSASPSCTVKGSLPDKMCSPGAVFQVTAAQVCVSGYSKSVRNVSESTKNAVYAEYGITTHSGSTYEMDHLIPLELGGSNDIKNLFPEAALPTPGFHEKDKVENYLHKQVCDGKMTLSTAQKQIATNWLAVYNSMNKKPTVPVKTVKATTTKTAVKTSFSPSQSTSQPAVKMSSSGICHAKGTTYYNATKKFTSFSSVKACLSAGGRLPKK